jgi:hypothetical protein
MEGAEELAKTVEALKKLDQRSDELLAWEACIFMVFDVLVERARERQQPLPLKQQSQKA